MAPRRVTSGLDGWQNNSTFYICRFILDILTAKCKTQNVKCKSSQWIISYNSTRANPPGPRAGIGRRAKTIATA